MTTLISSPIPNRAPWPVNSPRLSTERVQLIERDSRIKTALKDPDLRQAISRDLHRSITALALHDELWSKMLNTLSGDNPILETRSAVRPFRGAFDWHFRNRSAALGKALEPSIKRAIELLPDSDSEQLLFDWGTGDTQVAKHMQIRFENLKVTGGDILRYFVGDPQVPFHQIEANQVRGIESDSVSIVTLNYVLHHEAKAHEVFDECARILKPGGKLIITELIPQGRSFADRMQDTERLWFSDMLFCNIWHNNDGIPMPGNYRTVEEWSRFAALLGFSFIESRVISGTPVLYADKEKGRQTLLFEKSNF